MRLRHLTNDCANETPACRYEFVDRHRRVRHSLETAQKFRPDVFRNCLQHLEHRATVAQQVDDKGAPQIEIDSFMREEVAHIEKIARMLTIERSDHLPGVEVGKGHDVDFGEAERVFDRR